MKNKNDKKTPINKKLFILLTLLMTVVAGAFSSLRNITFDRVTGHATLDLNWLKLTLIFLLSFLTVFIHMAKAAPEKHYIKQVLCGASQSNRVIYLDYARITATLFVITTHTISAAASRLEPSGMPWLLLEYLSFLCLSCNLLFVMVSGSLLLEKKEKDLPSFYIKRVARVAIPMVLYYLCYLILLNGSSALKPSNWKNILRDILTGSPNAPHFWLISVILFLYIITPLLQRLSKFWTDSAALTLTIAFLIFDGLITYLPLFGVTLDFPMGILSWITVFIMGSLLHRNHDKRYEILILSGGLISLAVSLLLITFTDVYPSLIYNTAPTMVLIASSLFLLLKRKFSPPKTIPPYLACISRYSFSILLIHWYLLFYIVEGKLHLNGLSLHIAGGIILTVTITLTLSLLFAILFDNTIVLCTDFLFQKICGYLFTIVKNAKKNNI